MRSIFFQGMLDFSTNMPIAMHIDWWFVRHSSLFTLATLWFHSRVRLILVQTSQSQRALIAGLSDILLFSLWQPFGAGNENMICLADDSWCTIFEMRNGGKTKRRGDKKKDKLEEKIKKNIVIPPPSSLLKAKIYNICPQNICPFLQQLCSARIRRKGFRPPLISK